MKLELKRIETPFVMELTNENGNVCVIDANPAIGGKDMGFRPMELLAGALAGCISVDVLNILRKQRIEPLNYSISIDAKRSEGIPSPFEEIQLIFKISAPIDTEKLKKAIDLTISKYCSVSASLKNEIIISYELIIE